MQIKSLSSLCEIEFDKLLDIVGESSGSLDSVERSHEYSKAVGQLTDKLGDGTTLKVVMNESQLARD
jgi:hypothetical protein